MDNIENVYQAIQCLSGQNPTDANTAAQWLAQFQKSVYAWSIVDIILAQKKNYNASYFAAQTMRQKVLYDFKELPKDSYIALRDSLINHLKSVDENAENSAIIITQLALALADLFLQVPEWNCFISEILTRFNQGPDVNLNIMLNLLKVFPEELQNRHLRLGENRRTAVEKELAAESDAVFNCLKQIMETYSSNMVMLKKVIQCLGAWLTNKQCPTDSLAESPLMHLVLHLLVVSQCPLDLFEAVSECLVNSCLLIDDTRKHTKLATIIQQGLFASV
uniref:Importin N-terminal domain-containing protein n=1 Tax=Acrobeloides nanus TaxID=290746 RepID=A0A914E232_9BILA